MAEKVSFVPESEDDDDEESTSVDSSKSARRAAGLGASLFGRELTTKPPAEKPAPRSLAEALNSLVKKDQKEIDAEKARSEPWDEPESTVVTPIDARAAPTEETHLQSRDLYPTELGEGEAVLDLHPENITADKEEYVEDIEVTPEESDVETIAETVVPEAFGELDDDISVEDDPSASSATTSRFGGGGGRSSSSSPSASTTGGSSRSTPSASTPTPGSGTPPPPPFGPPAPGTSPSPNQPPVFANVTTTHNAATTFEIADAARRGERRGLGRGLVTGLVLGGGIEHIRHKRREKRIVKAHKKEQKAAQGSLEAMKAEQSQAERQRLREAYWEQQTEKRQEAAVLNQAKHEQRYAAERVQPQTKITEKVNAEQEALAVPSGHRLEQSAWHNIEVDEHGRAVEQSQIEYGHEYYRERSQERAPQDDVHGAAGEVALVAAALHDQPAQTAQVIDAKIAANAPRELPQQQPKTSSQAIKQLVSPPTTALGTLVWSMVLVFLVLLGVFLVH